MIDTLNIEGLLLRTGIVQRVLAGISKERPGSDIPPGHEVAARGLLDDVHDEKPGA